MKGVTWNQERQEILLISLLAIVYTVGVFVLGLELNPDFILLTPANLLFSAGILIASHQTRNRSFFLFMVVAALAGFGVEVLGVNYGFLFGNYVYGPVLGYKLWATPLLIGVNWFMLIYATGVTVNWCFLNASWWVKAGIAAVLMLLLDFLIEPVAIYYNFWQWEGEVIPLSNYTGWYLVSYLLLVCFYVLLGQVINKAGTALLILQFLFFGILNMLVG